LNKKAGNQAFLQLHLVSPANWEYSRTTEGILEKFCLQITRRKSSPGPV